MAPKLVKKLQQYSIVHLLYIITFFTSGLIINVVQAMFYWTLRFYDKRLYRRINYYLMYSFQSQLAFIPSWWAESNIKLYVDKDDYKKYFGKEHALLLGNHSYEVDWLLGWQLGESLGVLGNCKSLVKRSLQYVPVLGWSWKFGEYIFLDRSFEKDKETINRQISEMGEFPDPVLMVLFAEGTRLTPEKLKNSQKFAMERGLPILKHHLLPRVRGFITSVQGMRDKVHAIYDGQLAFHKNAEISPSIWNAILGKPVEGHMYIKRIKVEDLPKDDESLTKWLYAHYEEKDKMQESFHNTGSFFKETDVAPLEPITITKRIWPLINGIAWNIIVLVPLLRFSIAWVFTGGLFNLLIATVFVIMVHFAMKGLVGNLEMDKTSNYGSTK